jgi:hypothetical protein
MNREKGPGKWSQAFIDAGHTFVLDEEGEPDFWAVSQDIHNGPRCSTCGYSCCAHCTKAKNIPQCRNKG